MSKCDNCGITPAYEGGVFCTNCKPMTNADRIRAMTDEELAEFFAAANAQRLCFRCDTTAVREDMYEWLDWLRREQPKEDE